MPRPHKRRLIVCGPAATLFKPAGVPGRSVEKIELRLDELEALRLVDLEGLYHAAAAACMGISRATFGRLIAGAHGKVADALLNSKALVIRGGNVALADVCVVACGKCAGRFQIPFGTGRPEECPACGSAGFRRAAAGARRNETCAGTNGEKEDA